MLKLKLHCFGYPMQRADSLEKTLVLGRIEGKGRKGQQRMRWLDMSLSKLWEIVKDRGAWRAAVYGVAESDMTAIEQQQKPLHNPDPFLSSSSLGFLLPPNL